MKSYFDCWAHVAAELFSQALAGEPELTEALAGPPQAGAFGFAATLAGDVQGGFAVLLDPALLEAPLLGEGTDQKIGWKELLREAADAAAGELLASTGKKCQVTAFDEITELWQASRAFRLRAGERSWTLLVENGVREARPENDREARGQSEANAATPTLRPESGDGFAGAASLAQGPGLELLLDVELEATLRFGSREMPLGEILELGPGDVVELDRHVSDPVDLIVGDKIVARGDVVLVNGNFGLRVTEVAAPKKRLESIRCLF
jgi:flagellar motor switch protein FliN